MRLGWFMKEGSNAENDTATYTSSGIISTIYNFSYQSKISSATFSQPGSPAIKWLFSS